MKNKKQIASVSSRPRKDKMNPIIASGAKQSRAVFLDRDGVINDVLFFEDMGLLETPFTVAQFKMKKGVPQAVRKINQMGFKAIVASNQPGLARGNFSMKTFTGINQKMTAALKKEGAHLDALFYCVHDRKHKCPCRKPKPGLLKMAAQKYGLDLKRSYMIGDSITDVEAGLKAGCKTILLAHLKCDLCHLMAKRGIKPHYMAKDLLAASKLIQKLEAKNR